MVEEPLECFLSQKVTKLLRIQCDKVDCHYSASPVVFDDWCHTGELFYAIFQESIGRHVDSLDVLQAKTSCGQTVNPQSHTGKSARVRKVIKDN